MPARYLAVCIVMLLASGLAVAMKPTKLAADSGPRVQLDAMVPTRFGGWEIDKSIVPVQVSPDLQAKLNQVYDQTLSRTYVNRTGDRIMLSIAYGGNHGEGMQTHRPEVCYPAQGFNIVRALGSTSIQTAVGGLPVTRLVAALGSRVEPITYWVVVGTKRTDFGARMKLAQLRYNLTGIIPDGMLVRVSSIDRDDGRAYAIQETFISDFLTAIKDTDRLRLMGTS